MTHTFDATGALLDAMGRAQTWWTDADQREFQKRAQCIMDQYEGYSIEPGVHHQGKLVLNRRAFWEQLECDRSRRPFARATGHQAGRQDDEQRQRLDTHSISRRTFGT